MELSQSDVKLTKSVCYGQIKTRIRQTIDILNLYEKESFRSTDLNHQEVLLNILSQNYKLLQDRFNEIKEG